MAPVYPQNPSSLVTGYWS